MTLEHAVILLNLFLTGQTDGSRHQAIRHNGTTFSQDRFIEGELYYLADGGYSRIRCNPMDGCLLLSSESLPEVKAIWESTEAKCLRALVSRLARQVMSQEATR